MGCPGTWAGSESWVLASSDAIEPPHDAYRVALYRIRPSLPIRPAGKPLAAVSERIKPRFPLQCFFFEFWRNLKINYFRAPKP